MSGLRIDNLKVAYGENRVFDGFGISFEQNTVNVILGGSGVGKTTLLNVIAGLVPYSGSVSGADDNISYIFQKDRLIPAISVYKNLDLVLRNKIKDKNERKEKIEKMLVELEILSERDKLPTALSGGQAQRVSMARAFLYPSDILLMDEPFKALDIGLKSRLFSAFDKLLAESPKTVVFVTHDVEECLFAADRYFVLGGSPADVVLSGEIAVGRKQRKADMPELVSARARLFGVLGAYGSDGGAEN